MQAFLARPVEQACLGTSLCFRFNTFKVLDQLEDELSVSDNPFAQAVLTTKIALSGKKVSVNELYRLKIDLAKRLLRRNISKVKIVKLMHFLEFYIQLGNDQLDKEFKNEINGALNPNPIPMTIEEAILYIVKEEGVEKGLEQGIAKGHLERNTTVVRNLLRETKFTQREIARLVGVPAAFVREIKRKL